MNYSVKLTNDHHTLTTNTKVYLHFQTLLSTCNNLVNHDLYRQLAMLCITATRGIVPKQEACNICSKLLTNIPDSVICFR